MNQATTVHGPEHEVRPDTGVLTRGFEPSLSVGSVRPAVFRSSTYVFRSPESAERAFAVALGKVEPDPGEDVDLIYSRISHPNAEILEAQILPLEEGAAAAAVFNSGLAALATTFLATLRPGSCLVHTDPLYGGTHHFLHEMLVPMGVHVVPVPAGDTAALIEAVGSSIDVRMILVETPANPTLVMSDIAAAVGAAEHRRERPLVAVDNTFMGPAFQHPLALGADLSIYSATKYLSGGSDMLGGVVLGRDAERIRALRRARGILGTILQPDECWLLDSRLPTVRLRMERQGGNALKIVEGLQGHPRVERMHFPGTIRDPEQRRIFESQCDSPGAIFSMDLKGGKAAAFDFLRGLRILHNAVSLGGVESLACHPASTVHSEMSPEEQARCGITPGMVRVSVGVEDWRDLLDAIKEGLDGIGRHRDPESIWPAA